MALGANSYVRMKKNSTWGSAATFATTAMLDIPFTSEGFRVVKDREDSGNISGGVARANINTLGTRVEWDLNGQCLYNRMSGLLYGVMGAISTAASSLEYTHTITPAATLPVWDFEVSKGNVPASKVYKFQSNKVSRLTITAPARGRLTFSASGVGYNEVSTATTGSDPATSAVDADAGVSTSYKTNPIDASEAGGSGGVYDIGTGADGAYCVKSFTVTIDRKLPTDDFCIGSATPAEPNPNDFMDVTGEFTIKFIDRAAYDDFLLQSDLVANMRFESAATAKNSGTLKRTLNILINKLRYDSPGGLVLVDTPGELIARVPFTAFGTGGTDGTNDEQPIAFEVIDNVDSAAL